MKRLVLASLSIATVLHVAPSFAAYDFKSEDFPGASQTYLFAVNDFEQIVGEYIDSANATHALLVEGKRFLPVDPQGVIGKSASSHSYSINALGNIAGSYADAASVLHGYVFHPGTGVVSPVEYPGGLPTEAYGINDLGQVIGVYYTPDGNLHAFELTNGVYKAEDVPGSLTTVPLSINDRGQIVGYYLTVAGSQGYLRDADGHFTTYNAPGAPPDSSFLISINNLDETVGGYTDAAGNADNILLFGLGAKPAPLALPASFAPSYQSFQTINDLGEIVGYYNDASGNAHGFVAKPEGI